MGDLLELEHFQVLLAWCFQQAQPRAKSKNERPALAESSVWASVEGC